MFVKLMLFTQAQQQGNPLISFLPIIIMFVALYLLFILPQQRADKKHKKMLNELKKGDRIITQSGILGNVAMVKDDIVHVEIAPKVEIRVLKSAITKVIADDSEAKANG